ncbi:PREDICTED: non-homologous end-joining factor 1 [Thamnophis sirtalis]|uniref:Non-homologous end-joining factor 1 n=1 Tax=Thamnophis sirtalis TaxID=35019 RepID=A0A6I9Y460_9SAUR|nr:PREDICTED: non-homologous end-joining factor 1 [Thamnophis sirtalis]XP_032086117.1 non-homologous end-joining factor 1 [Thamnophis elegans]XP_032086124.1 non-homologous end-joining factor 1 [Thamnophis elegans]
METSDDPQIKVLLQPWASVCFSESTRLMAKAWFCDSSYILLLSDLNNMWYESANTEVIQQRSKELNKRLTAPAASILNCLHNLLSPLLEGKENSSVSFSCQLSSSTLILHVKSELLGLPFYWDFHCGAAPQEMISRHLLRPLMTMSVALHGQVQELASLLLQKDAEIEDYRESGATLSLERLKTEPFKEESFLRTFETETLPQACCLGDGRMFTSNLKSLYLAVTQQQARAACKRHRAESEDSGSLNHAASQDPTEEPVDLPEAEEQIETQLSSAQHVEEAVVQKAQVPVVKTKKKKVKGLFV